MNDGFPEACYVMPHIGTGPSNLEMESVPPPVVQRDCRRFELREDIWIEQLDRERPDTLQRLDRVAAGHQIWPVTLYDKNEASDLTPIEKRASKSAVENELRARQAARLAGQGKSRRGLKR
jgi:hypothetical protein